jgi:hypothetical protein
MGGTLAGPSRRRRAATPTVGQVVVGTRIAANAMASADDADGELRPTDGVLAEQERPGRAYVEGVHDRGADSLAAARQASGTELRSTG